MNLTSKIRELYSGNKDRLVGTLCASLVLYGAYRIAENFNDRYQFESDPNLVAIGNLHGWYGSKISYGFNDDSDPEIDRIECRRLTSIGAGRGGIAGHLIRHTHLETDDDFNSLLGRLNKR